jgi:hypothetical protein
MTLALLLLVLLACSGRTVGGAEVETNQPVASAVEGVAHDGKAGALVVAADGRRVYVSGVDRWPPGIEGLVVRVEGPAVEEARSPRATQGADGAWSQGVAPDAPPEWWVDGPWSVMGAEPASAPWTLRVHDGSGNSTTVSMAAGSSTAAWAYTPVTPEQSSSGTYSGGAAAEGSFDAATLATLWGLVHGLERAKELHVAERAMGTTQVHVQTSAGDRAFVVRAGAAAELDALLVGARGR